jgi:hypothetical protein
MVDSPEDGGWREKLFKIALIYPLASKPPSIFQLLTITHLPPTIIKTKTAPSAGAA